MRQGSHAQVLNEAHSEGLRQALSRPKSTVDDAAFISIDRQGADVRVRRSNEYVVERMTFSTVRCCFLEALLHLAFMQSFHMCISQLV